MQAPALASMRPSRSTMQVSSNKWDFYLINSLTNTFMSVMLKHHRDRRQFSLTLQCMLGTNSILIMTGMLPQFAQSYWCEGINYPPHLIVAVAQTFTGCLCCQLVMSIIIFVQQICKLEQTNVLHSFPPLLFVLSELSFLLQNALIGTNPTPWRG